MSRTWKAGVVLFCAVCLAANTAFGATRMGRVTVKEGPLTGTVTDSQGKPAAKVAIEVADANGAVTAKAVSDAKGKYDLKGLRAGEYKLTLDKQLSVALHVDSRGRVSDLKLVLPGGYSAGAWLPTTAVGWTLLGVGVVGVTWVTVATLENNDIIFHSSSSDGNPATGATVSP